jgi:hypothetical protein
MAPWKRGIAVAGRTRRPSGARRSPPSLPRADPPAVDSPRPMWRRMQRRQAPALWAIGNGGQRASTRLQRLRHRTGRTKSRSLRASSLSMSLGIDELQAIAHRERMRRLGSNGGKMGGSKIRARSARRDCPMNWKTKCGTSSRKVSNKPSSRERRRRVASRRTYGVTPVRPFLLEPLMAVQIGRPISGVATPDRVR